jgi:hypothetical protein
MRRRRGLRGLSDRMVRRSEYLLDRLRSPPPKSTLFATRALYGYGSTSLPTPKNRRSISILSPLLDPAHPLQPAAALDPPYPEPLQNPSNAHQPLSSDGHSQHSPLPRPHLHPRPPRTSAAADQQEAQHRWTSHPPPQSITPRAIRPHRDGDRRAQ